MPLSREQIRERIQLPTEDVYVPEWGDTVRLRGLTAHEASEFQFGQLSMNGQQPTVDLKKMRGVQTGLVARTAVDESGDALFTEKEWGKMPATVVELLFHAAQKLCGFSKEAVDEMAGKSETTPPDDSDSD